MQNESLQNRSIYHDLLRILSTFAVICIHVCAESLTWKQENFSSSTWFFLNIFNSISRFSVPVFVMLSGSFMIEKFKKSDLKKLYTKNILHLVCSFVFWSAAYIAVDVVKNLFIEQPPIVVSEMIGNLIKGEFHLWFIPMIVFLYATTPLICKICDNTRNERYFLILSSVPIVFNFINNYVPLESVTNLFENAGMQFVSGYTVYYVLGHYLTKYDISKKYRAVVYLLAVISVFVTVVLAYRDYVYALKDTSYVYEYMSPNVLLVSVSVFILFKYGVSRIKFKERTTKFVVKLSSLTFGIYLTHIIFLKTIYVLTPISVESIHPVISVPLLIALVFIASAITTYVISKIPILKKYII